MIDRTHDLPVTRPCQLLNLARSTLYYPPPLIAPAALALMRQIDEIPLECPFAGTRMRCDLLRKEGHRIGRKQTRTLMRKMGIKALYPRPNTSQRHPADRVFPYRLRDRTVDRPN